MAITAKVLQELGFVSNKDFILDAEKDMEWLSDQPQPSEAEISAGQASWDAKEYARNRKIEYDRLNQFELMTDDNANSTTTHADAIAAIKTKWPKDNSGPK